MLREEAGQCARPLLEMRGLDGPGASRRRQWLRIGKRRGLVKQILSLVDELLAMAVRRAVVEEAPDLIDESVALSREARDRTARR